MEGAMEEKRSYQQKKSLETQEMIKNTALRLFSEKGITRTRIKDICDGAGISVGAFYYYYASKEEILDADREVYDGKLIEYISEISREKDPKEFINKLVLYYAEMNKAFAITFLPRRERVMLSQAKDVRGEWRLLCDSYVEKAQENGTMTRNMTPQETVDYIIMVANGVLFKIYSSPNDEYDVESLMLKAMLPLYPYFIAEGGEA